MLFSRVYTLQMCLCSQVCRCVPRLCSIARNIYIFIWWTIRQRVKNERKILALGVRSIEPTDCRSGVCARRKCVHDIWCEMKSIFPAVSRVNIVRLCEMQIVVAVYSFRHSSKRSKFCEEYASSHTHTRPWCGKELNQNRETTTLASACILYHEKPSSAYARPFVSLPAIRYMEQPHNVYTLVRTTPAELLIKCAIDFFFLFLLLSKQMIYLFALCVRCVDDDDAAAVVRILSSCSVAANEQSTPLCMFPFIVTVWIVSMRTYAYAYHCTAYIYARPTPHLSPSHTCSEHMCDTTTEWAETNWHVHRK